VAMAVPMVRQGLCSVASEFEEEKMGAALICNRFPIRHSSLSRQPIERGLQVQSYAFLLETNLSRPLRSVRVSPAAVKEPRNGGFDERRDFLDLWRFAQTQRALDIVISP
jgi:hypothetical protein